VVSLLKVTVEQLPLFFYLNYGYAADITVKHVNCTEESILKDFYNFSNKWDTIISYGCPNNAYAYDGSMQAPIREGDTVVSFGACTLP
jgi:hypothetical protein